MSFLINLSRQLLSSANKQTSVLIDLYKGVVNMMIAFPY